LVVDTCILQSIVNIIITLLKHIFMMKRNIRTATAHKLEHNHTIVSNITEFYS